MSTAKAWSTTPDTLETILTELCLESAPILGSSPTAIKTDAQILNLSERGLGSSPTIVVAQQRFDREIGLRSEIISARDGIIRVRQELASDLKREGRNSPERKDIYRALEKIDARLAYLTMLHEDHFVPIHGPKQLLSPQQLLMSGIFNVRSKTIPRESELTFESTSVQHKKFTYEGPELRQSDGFVFMALINMARDFRAGTLVSFDAAEVCCWLNGYYDGAGRKRLRQSVHRLQKALLIFEGFSVQLAMSFKFPPRDRWTVMLDPEIVKMFNSSRYVWLDFNVRKSLPDGLASWLYAYVEAQTKLIPHSVTLLRKMCGSASLENRNFNTTLVRALGQLTQMKIIDGGWSISNDVLRWRKFNSTATAQ